jgi:hypothetical protein
MDDEMMQRAKDIAHSIRSTGLPDSEAVENGQYAILAFAEEYAAHLGNGESDELAVSNLIAARAAAEATGTFLAFDFRNSTDAPAVVGGPCFAEDDETVSAKSCQGVRPYVGRVTAVRGTIASVVIDGAASKGPR